MSYGDKGGFNNLFRSYYSNRKQFVKLDNVCSTLRDSPNLSVVQGSRLSGIMFNTYCNEIPKLPLLINTDIYYKLIEKKIRHKKYLSYGDKFY